MSDATSAEQRLEALRRGIAWVASGGQPLTPDTLRRLLEGDDRHEAPGAAEKLLGERERMLALLRRVRSTFWDEWGHIPGCDEGDIIRAIDKFLRS